MRLICLDFDSLIVIPFSDSEKRLLIVRVSLGAFESLYIDAKVIRKFEIKNFL